MKFKDKAKILSKWSNRVDDVGLRDSILSLID